MMMNRRWIVIVACLVVVGLIVGVVAAFGLSSPQSVSSQAKQGPSAAQLENLQRIYLAVQVARFWLRLLTFHKVAKKMS